MARELKMPQGGSKDVSFCIDYSSSMAGERFRRTMINFQVLFNCCSD